MKIFFRGQTSTTPFRANAGNHTPALAHFATLTKHERYLGYHCLTMANSPPPVSNLPASHCPAGLSQGSSASFGHCVIPPPILMGHNTMGPQCKKQNMCTQDGQEPQEPKEPFALMLN